MPRIANRMSLGSIALSVAIALVALILTSFFDAAPNGTDVGTVTFDVPAGGRWCAPQDALGTKSCRYQTFEHCLSAVRAVYGTCRPNPAAVLITDEGPYRTYHSMSRIENGAAAVD